MLRIKNKFKKKQVNNPPSKSKNKWKIKNSKKRLKNKKFSHRSQKKLNNNKKVKAGQKKNKKAQIFNNRNRHKVKFNSKKMN